MCRTPTCPRATTTASPCATRPGAGRDAADDRIVELLDEGAPGTVQVVTSDRALADSARARGAEVTGAGRFLGQLQDAGC